MRLTGRTKDRYNPTPNAKERRFHLALMQLPCLACGLEPCGVFHHLMSAAPHKRWKRDHELGLNLCDECHRALHRHGDEQEWCAANMQVDAIFAATSNRAWGRGKGFL